jgi:arginine N-succinyltransferase
MFIIREALPGDLEDVLRVAEHLNSVNLPADRDSIREILDLSSRSFSGELAASRREYVFALEDGDARRVVGTSMIHAQHGQRGKPHIYFDVYDEERYSDTLDRHYVHRVLRLGFNYNGPTEIGGLSLLPEYRGHPKKLGRALSYVRFLFIAAHREWFRDEVISELLPPLEPDGTSRLWEALGRRFTGLSYQEADRISQGNKEFIRALFPGSPVYTSLLSDEARAIIGEVGPATRGVERMLKAVGFRYAQRIDPFDGGPHFHARTDEVKLVKAARKLAVGDEELSKNAPRALVAAERPEPPRLLATVTRHRVEDDHVLLPGKVREALGSPAELWVTPASA